jgi:hypothetical protein
VRAAAATVTEAEKGKLGFPSIMLLFSFRLEVFDLAQASYCGLFRRQGLGEPPAAFGLHNVPAL